MKKNSFHKGERLKSRKSIENLFKRGMTISSPPYRMLFRVVEGTGEQSLLMTVAVPKKLIKRAVDRNLIKRRTREAYRLQKGDLLRSKAIQARQIEMVFLYQAEDIRDFKKIKNAVNFILQKLNEKLLDL